MTHPFLYAWDYSPHRDRKHGALPEGLAGDRFVVCLQNHDQVGNRARGDRFSTLLHDPARQRLASSLLLLSPYLPLLFMGEEYGEENPFPFFCSFGDPPLIEAVREGRKARVRRLRRGGRSARSSRRGDFPLRLPELVLARGNAEGGVAPIVWRSLDGPAGVADTARFREENGAAPAR